jgi:hypothetical protein
MAMCHNAPYFIILLSLMPDHFTRQGESAAIQCVNPIKQTECTLVFTTRAITLICIFFQLCYLHGFVNLATLIIILLTNNSYCKEFRLINEGPIKFFNFI